MTIFFWILVAILIFAIIILIHEFGHFYAARKFWVKVEEFGLWIPPRAKKLFVDKSGTLFSLNWLPIWGFVKIAWENPNFFNIYDEQKNLIKDNKILILKIKNKEKLFDRLWKEISKKDELEILKKINEENASYNFKNKPAWQQSIILLAWVFMNFVLAFVIFTILFFVWVKPIWVNSYIKTDLDLKLLPNLEQAEKINFWKQKWFLLAPIKNTVAEKSWLKKWDWLVKINWEEVNKIEKLLEFLNKNKNKKLTLSIKRNFNFDEKIEKTYPNLNNTKDLVVNIKVSNEAKIWIYVKEYFNKNPDFKYKFWVIDSVKYWFLETVNQTALTFVALWDLWQKIFSPKTPVERAEAIDSMAWPVWIVNIITKIFEKWFVFLLLFWALISINLWVMNILPIPALDWWRFLIVVINGFFKKFFKKKLINSYAEVMIHSLFFIILMWLIMLITYNDITKLL